MRPPMFRNSYDHVQRRLALEHLAGDRLRAVASAALGAEILPVRLDGHAEQAPLRRPVDVEGQLGAAAEGRDVAGMAAADGPGHQVGTALVVDPLPVPGGDDGGPYPAAVLADDRQRVPLVGMLGRWPPVGRCPARSRRGRAPRGCIGPSRRRRRPRSSSRRDPAGRRGARTCPGRARRSGARTNRGRRRLDPARGPAGAPMASLHGIGRQQRLGIHRVQVVDAVEVGGLQCRRARRARTITSLMTGPRRLPTWTVPDGVFESLRTWGPERRAASSSAQNMGAGRLADADDGVGDRTGRSLDVTLSPFLCPIRAAPTGDSLLIRPVARGGLGRADDGEGLLPIGSLDHDLGADADLVAVDLLDDLGVLELRLERARCDPPGTTAPAWRPRTRRSR